MANPRVRPFLHFYPEENGLSVNETWHANHWLHEADSSLLTPMARINNQDYYIYEPALLANITVCMPYRWFLRKGKFFAKAWKLHPNVNSFGWIVHTFEIIEISDQDLLLSFPLLKSSWKRYNHLNDPSILIGVSRFISSFTTLVKK